MAVNFRMLMGQHEQNGEFGEVGKLVLKDTPFVLLVVVILKFAILKHTDLMAVVLSWAFKEP